MTSSQIQLLVGVLIMVGFAIAFTAWVVHVRRHPVKRMPSWLSAVGSVVEGAFEVQSAFIYAVIIFIVLWVGLEWTAYGVSSGHWALSWPKRSPWSHWMLSRHYRPWNLIAQVGGFIGLVALVFRFFRRERRLIDAGLVAVAHQLGLTLKRGATGFASRWWEDHLQRRLLGTLSLSTGEDLAFIANVCWALYDPHDMSRILLVSWGRHPESMGWTTNRMALWTCLYLARDGGCGHALAHEAQQVLRERKFQVDAHSDYARIVDLREYQMTGGPAIIRAATAPERLAELWRLTTA